MSFARTIMASMLALAIAGEAAAQITFAPAVNYPAAGGPFDLRTADFNGDGKLDFVVLLQGLDAISIRLGNGDGTFGGAQNFAVGDFPFGVAVGDLNGDGKLDLAVANYFGNSVSILLGNGDGTFAAQTALAAGPFPAAVALADFNGDGKLDLAVADSGVATISIRLGNGDGTFGSILTLPTGSTPDAVVAVDFNGDGKIDLAVSNTNDDSVSILLGNGDGTFAPRQDFATGPQPVGLATGDFNGDGRLDIAVARNAFPPGSSVEVLRGIGDGTLGLFPVALAAPSRSLFVVGADFNRDGRLDVATAYETGEAGVFRNNGNGTFDATLNFTVRASPVGIAAGDFNGDGKVDLAVANNSDNSVSVLLSTTLVAPLPPTGVTATAGDAQASIAFTPPTDALSLPIIDYTATCFVGTTAIGSATGTASPIVVTGLINGVSHNCSVQARNAGGLGAPSAPASVLPKYASAIAITTTGSPILVNDPVTFTATVTADPAGGSVFGFLTFRADGVAIGGCGALNVFAAGGSPQCATSFDTPGTKVITAQYNGDGLRFASTGTLAGGQVVNLATTTTAIATSASPVAVGTQVTFTATVTGTSPTGTVTFQDGGVTICDAVPLTGITAQCLATFASAGTKVITAQYAGDAVNAASTGTLAGGQVVTLVPTVTTLAASATTVVVNASVTFTATVTGLGPTGTVTFRNGGVAIAACTAVALTTGTAQCITSFATTGTKVITAEYSGNAANGPSSGTLAGGVVVNASGSTVRVTTSSATVLLFDPVTYTATVTGASPTGTVGFTDASNGGPFTALPGCTAVPLVAGRAQCTMTYTAISAATGAGLHFITATYSGDAGNLPASGNLIPQQIVDRTPTTTTLVTSASPVTTGTSVTFTATVGPFLPAGAINFKDGGVSIAGCNSVLLVGATVRSATCTTSFATAGTKVITAEFSGNGVQNPSTGTLAGGQVVTSALTNSFTGPTATGTGNATVSFTGGGATCTFAPQSAFFIPVTGHAKSPPAGTAPAGVQFPQGLLDFVLTGCTPGSTIAFTVTYPTALPGGALYWKFGPTADQPTPHWYTLPALIGGNVASFTITDGGLGDDDLAANGTVVDQGGPGAPLAAIPTLSEWALILLAMLLMLTAGMRRRRN